MEVVIIEKKTFEALLSGVETLTGKVGALCRRCNDKQTNLLFIFMFVSFPVVPG